MDITEIKNDFNVITEMLRKYNSFIWENQEGQASHYDSQPKNTRLALADIRTGLFITKMAMNNIIDNNAIITDKEE